MKRSATAAIALLLILVAAMAMKESLIALPDVGEGAAEGGFDTGRAMARLGRVLGEQRPHPVDTAANDAVRARLVAELRALGLEPRVTDDVACNGRGRGIACARVRNVVATLGPESGQKHVMLVSHYDSTPAGPGAADDGIGVAVMLETAAILRRRPLARPVTLLFNEGEEAGLLGARAFMQRDPLAGRVSAIVNLESRGVTGPAIMFETSRPNGAPIEHYARSAERPSANSLATDFYKMVPNSTDVAVFEERSDWTILNFAIIGNETRYHSPGDRIENLDPRSVRHMGGQALALTADLATRAPSEDEGSYVYADLLGRDLVVISTFKAFALIALLLFVFGRSAWERREGLGRGVLTVLAALAGAAALTFLGKLVVGLFRAGEYWRAYPEVTSLAALLSALLASLGALAWLARDLDVKRLRIAFWLLFLLLGAGVGAAAPGAAIFFLLPPLVLAVAIMLERWSARAEAIGGALAFLLLFLTWAPLLHLLEMLLDQDSPWMFAPLAALILLPALIELKPVLAALPRRVLVGGAAAAAVAGWIGTAAAPAYSEERKQHFTIEYALEADGRTHWLVANDGAPLPAGFSGASEERVEVPWAGRPRWTLPAPAGGATAPTAEIVSQRRVPEGRFVSLRLRANGAETLVIEAPPEASLRAAAVGSAVRRFGEGEPDDDYAFRCTGRSCDGLRVDLLIGSPAPVEATLTGIRSGLPPGGERLLRARPADAAPQYGADATIAQAKIRL